MASSVEPLVGRAAEIAALERALDDLGETRGGALAFAGEPGIGKTRLLGELGARADAQGCIVLSGSASELERELPFWVFVDALDEYVGGLGPRGLKALADEELAGLAQVLPSLAEAREADAAGDQRYRVHRAVRGLLDALAATKPLVLLLDDLHWADSGSVELVGALLRRPPSASVLMAFVVRPRQVPERLAGALERASRDASLTWIELEALSRDEARELLGETVDAALATDLYRESGGIPLYLEQLARTRERVAPSGGRGSGVSLGGVEVPRAVAAGLSEELALLRPDVRGLLAGASVAGDPFAVELAGAAAGLPEPAAMDALDELLRHGFVHGTDVPRRFRFRHPIVRRAVYDAAPGGWRIGAHQRAAEFLAARGASPVERAHHIEHSARQGDLGAVALLRDAGEMAAPRAPATAIRSFAAALRLLPDTAPPLERIELLRSLAGAQAIIGQYGEAHAALRESLELVPGDAVALRVALTAACAGVEHPLGRHEEAHTRLVAAIDQLPDERSPEALLLMIELALDGVYGQAYESMRDWATRALNTSRMLGDRPLMGASAALIALANGFLGAVAEGEASRAEAAEIVAELSDTQLARRLDAVLNLAAAEFYLDRLEEASAHVDRALAVGRATGQAEAFFVTYPIVGNIQMARGDLAAAADFYDASVDMARLSGNAQLLAWNLFNRSLVATAAGDVELALATASGSTELLETLEASPMLAWGGHALAAALLAAGEPREAEEVLLRTAGGEQLSNVPGGYRTRALELLTRCRIALGRPDDAARSSQHARALADELGLPLAQAMSNRAEAAVALNAGDASSAAEHALAAAALADQVGAPVDAALCRFLAGRALADAGETDRAAVELEAAAAAFEACAALGHRDATERELGKLGRRPHRRSRRGKADGTGIETLTERELEVARLIVDRKTNAQIAADLFLSPKTVESHIRHLFEKLSVSSRVEVARVVERAERTTR